MAENENNKTYWPHMILGFVVIGVVLGYWTIKSAIRMPVHESNEYMMKYQKADLGANEIIEAQHRFDSRYRVALKGMEPSDFKPEHLKRRHGEIVALQPVNRIVYEVTDKAGNTVSDANVSLLLTRPHTEKDDQKFDSLSFKEGHYVLERLELKKPGRYILRVRVQKGDAVGYMDTEGYLKPAE
jgi:hypothetical protein